MIPQRRAVLRVGPDARLLSACDTVAACRIDNERLLLFLHTTCLFLREFAAGQCDKAIRRFALKLCLMVGMIGVIECCVSASVAAAI
jgi:hypothetical protein